ncbi:YkvA family protein [Umezawaea sp. Da 62-37]|uniref:YkvA family protein n=1 Tax=Umezawaea sp. Da 62-37 TaxID=3075927 RepID=UPI0028F706F8|nr:YkvA family protein [Umezawaea sp. Da 62-37]WNV84403.1 YkvA family protein [Umezawaea sp. Da 62-37]
MVFFGGLLVLLALLTLVFRDADIGGIAPTTVGITLLVVGALSIGLGFLRKAQARRRRAARGEPEPVGNVFERARALPRLLRAARSKEGYAGLPKGRMALWGFALLYLVSPIDILPEFLPIIGVTDDAGVAVWLLTSVSAAAGMYLNYERDRKNLPPAR